jgi:glycosyltransferase involved in cell wall biosynthesis
MRLCFIANPNLVHTQRWVRHFVERGDEVFLITEHEVQRDIPAGVTLFDLTAQTNVRKLRYVTWARAVRGIVRELQPDILHAHQVASAGWLGAAAVYHPFVVSAWGSDLLVGPKRSWAQRQLARWVLRRADYAICVSESLARAARSLGAAPDRVEVAAWGVDTNIFYPASDKESQRAQLGLPQEPIILSLRAMRAIYNPLDIARAIPSVLEQVPEAHFVILTYNCDQGVLSQFQAIVQSHGATDAVRYIGDLPNEQAVADVCRAADVALSVPSSDGTPVSVLEALACGAALVVSEVPSLHEWIKHEREGLFVPIGDVAGISDAIVRLLTDGSLQQRFRVNGPRLVRQRADRKVLMARNEEIYRELLERSRG